MESLSPNAFRSVLEHAGERADIACIDVRNAQEYAEAHIVGVQHIPLENLAEHIDELATKKEIYVHCRSGVRSQKACEMLEKMNIPAKMYNVEGGILAWQREGFPVVCSL